MRLCRFINRNIICLLQWLHWNINKLYKDAQFIIKTIFHLFLYLNTFHNISQIKCYPFEKCKQENYNLRQLIFCKREVN